MRTLLVVADLASLGSVLIAAWRWGRLSSDDVRLVAVVAVAAVLISRHQTGLWNHSVYGIGTWWPRVAYSNLLTAGWGLAGLGAAGGLTAASALTLGSGIAFVTLVRLALDSRAVSARRQKDWLIIGSDRVTDQSPRSLEECEHLDPGEALRRGLPFNSAVFVCASVSEEQALALRSAAQLRGTHLVLAPTAERLTFNLGQQGKIDDLPVVILRSPVPTKTSLLLTRAFDLMVAVPLVVILAPMGLVIALWIRRDSPGKALYQQTRVGLRGREFKILKFRTMVDDAERTTGPKLADADDRRITSLGRRLRARRIDEFPQLLNVLRGDMSVIGPRPERPVFVDELQRALPDYPLRHLVRPGITGLAQVAGNYSTDPEDKLAFDLRYIHGRSWSLDLRILLQTITIAFRTTTASGMNDARAEPTP